MITLDEIINENIKVYDACCKLSRENPTHTFSPSLVKQCETIRYLKRLSDEKRGTLSFREKFSSTRPEECVLPSIDYLNKHLMRLVSVGEYEQLLNTIESQAKAIERLSK